MLGQTPLHLLCANERIGEAASGAGLELIQRLVMAAPGATLLATSHGCTPLHLLCGNEAHATEPNLLALLAAAPVAATRRTANGWTPLHFLCRYVTFDPKRLCVLPRLIRRLRLAAYRSQLTRARAAAEQVGADDADAARDSFADDADAARDSFADDADVRDENKAADASISHDSGERDAAGGPFVDVAAVSDEERNIPIDLLPRGDGAYAACREALTEPIEATELAMAIPPPPRALATELAARTIWLVLKLPSPDDDASAFIAPVKQIVVERTLRRAPAAAASDNNDSKAFLDVDRSTSMGDLTAAMTMPIITEHAPSGRIAVRGLATGSVCVS